MRTTLNKIFILLFLPFFSIAQENDFQTWTSVSASKKLIKKTDLIVKQGARFRENSSVKSKLFTDIRIKRKYNKHFSFAVGYRFSNDWNKRFVLAQKKRLIPKAIIPVDLFGLPADYEQIEKVADEYDLFILEDAAQGFGGEIRGKKAGSFGDVAATSFFPAKPLGCYGDGGAIFTNDDDLAHIIRSIRIHGEGLDKYDNVRVGLNGRLDTIQAVVANYKLKNKLSNITKKRIKNALLFDKVFRNNPNVKTVKRFRHLKEVYHLYHINVKKRDQLQQYLIKNGVDAKVHYPIPIHLQPAAKYYPLHVA